MRGVGDARGRKERDHDADMSRVWEVAEHERVVFQHDVDVDFGGAAGAAAVHHGNNCVVVILLEAAAERASAEVVDLVDFLVDGETAVVVDVAIDDEAVVVECVEHQPRSLFLKQAAAGLVLVP